MQFVPLDPTRRGVYDYVFSKNLAKNKHVEFKVNYSDINDEEPVVMPVPSDEIDDPKTKLDEFPINFNAQFNIYRTGYYGLASIEDQKLIDSFKLENLSIAEVTLKIPNYDLLDCKRNNESREEYVNSLYSNVMNKKGRYEAMLLRKKIEPNIEWQTSISTFDIIYEHVLPELELQEGSKLAHCNKSIDKFRKIYGYKQLKRVEDIKNQCLFPLAFTFPELDKPVDLMKLNKRTNGFMNTFVLADHTKQTLETPSRILSIVAAEQIKKVIPSYLRVSVWRRLHTIFEDGISYRL